MGLGMRRCRLEGAPIVYHVDKTEGAPWVLLLHAAFVDHRMFRTQVEAFRGRYSIIAVDILGHGGSTEARRGGSPSPTRPFLPTPTRRNRSSTSSIWASPSDRCGIWRPWASWWASTSRARVPARCSSAAASTTCPWSLKPRRPGPRPNPTARWPSWKVPATAPIWTPPTASTISCASSGQAGNRPTRAGRADGLVALAPAAAAVLRRSTRRRQAFRDA